MSCCDVMLWCCSSLTLNWELTVGLRRAVPIFRVSSPFLPAGPTNSNRSYMKSSLSCKHKYTQTCEHSHQHTHTSTFTHTCKHLHTNTHVNIHTQTQGQAEGERWPGVNRADLLSFSMFRISSLKVSLFFSRIPRASYST